MNKVARIALVEFGGSHDECLYTQLKALKTIPVEVVFIGNQSIWERNTTFHGLFDDFIPFEKPKGILEKWKSVKRFNQLLTSHQIQHVVFNTAQGSFVRDLCLFAKKSISYFGILHTTNKLNGSFTQKLIHSKIKNYAFLNPYFLDKIQIPKGIRVCAFRPILFPTFQETIEKPNDECWIGIIGGVENRRKDLLGFQQFMQAKSSRSVHYFFLGKTKADEPAYQALLAVKNQIPDLKVTFFEDFIPETTFDAYVQKMDFLLPLIHPDTPSSEEYMNHQLPGALNIGLGYHIPFLMHEAYRDWEDLKPVSCYYNLEHLALDQFLAQQQVLKANYQQGISEESVMKDYLDFLHLHVH